MDRSNFTPYDSVSYVWQNLGLPEATLKTLLLPKDVKCCPSSFKVDHLAQATIALSALSAAAFWSHRQKKPTPMVSVEVQHACVEFMSERLYLLNGKSAPSSWGTLGGLHKTLDGYVRMHDSFPNHRKAALSILGLETDASRDDVAKRMLDWRSVELESNAFQHGAVIAALRSFDQWDLLPQAQAIGDFPIHINKLARSEPFLSAKLPLTRDGKCLQNIRVLEMSRVIAAPVAGRTLAAHGADVIWVTSPTLPDLPDLDIDVSRGKRTIQLDINRPSDKSTLIELLRTADVFIQSYRPGSLAAHGLSAEELYKINPQLIIASLNAYGVEGPWSHNRGFDSLVQTCSGLNVADATRFGGSEPVRVLPCQALDHGAGYLLATGIIAALYKRATIGGAYEVKVSLAGVMKYLRSLGQYKGRSGFQRTDLSALEDVERFLETRQTAFGELRAVGHSARIEGVSIGWEHMPKILGSDEPVWL